MKLYDYWNRQLYQDSVLEDAWVAPNEYRLIKRKGTDLWELFNGKGKNCDVGEHAEVFFQKDTVLVFLQQKGTAEWHFYDVSINSFEKLLLVPMAVGCVSGLIRI